MWADGETLIGPSYALSYWPIKHVLCLTHCIIKPCIHFWFIFLFSASLTVTGRSWGKLFHTLSHTCQSQTARCGKTGLSEQHARLTVFTSVSIWGDEGGAYCMSGVCLLLHQVCVYFRMSPHSLILVSVAVAACTCAWFRLQLAHLIFSLNPPLPSPLFPLHTFPPFFFFFFPPLLPLSCLQGIRGQEYDYLNTGGNERRGELPATRQQS